MINDYTVEYHLTVDFDINHFDTSIDHSLLTLAGQLSRVKSRKTLKLNIYPTYKNVILDNLSNNFYVCTNDINTEYIEENNKKLIANMNNYIVNIDYEIIQQLENALQEIRNINEIHDITAFSANGFSNNYEQFYQKIIVDFYREDPFVYRTDEQIINYFDMMVQKRYFGMYKCPSETIQYLNNIHVTHGINAYDYIDDAEHNDILLSIEKHDILDNNAESKYILSKDELKQLLNCAIDENGTFIQKRLRGMIYKCILNDNLIYDNTTNILTINEENNLTHSLLKQYKKYMNIYTVNDVRSILYDIQKEYDKLLDFILISSSNI